MGLPSGPGEEAERLVHSLGVREYLSDVGVQDNDVAALSEAPGILPSHAAAEVILLAHVGFSNPVFFIAHRIGARLSWPIVR